MKKLLIIFLALSFNTYARAQVKIGIIQIIQHQSLDKLRESAIEQVKAKGFSDAQVDFQNANGNWALMSQIVSQMLQKNYDLILAIGTPAAQMIKAKNKNTPIVFAPVTDPVQANLVSSLENPGGLITGTSDRVDYKALVKLMLDVSPHIKTIGVPYNAGELNSVSTFNTLKKECSSLAVELKSLGINDITSLPSAINSGISSGVDALLLPQDNTVASSVDVIIRLAARRGVPVYSTFNDAVSKGALAAFGIDYSTLGTMTGDIILRILNKENPGDIPVQSISNAGLVINLKNAKKMKTTFPESYLKSSTVL